VSDRIFWLVIVLLGLAGVCSAEPSHPRDASFSVANYIVERGQKRPIGGSATGIDRHLAVTNAHVAVALDRKPTLQHGLSKRKWTGEVVALDRNSDLALIWVASGDLPYVPLSTDGLSPGEPIYTYGYGSSRILRTASSTVRGMTGQRPDGVGVWHTGIAIEPGDSGSGIFNASGELCAVNWGAENGSGRNASTSSKHVLALGKYWEAQCGGGMCDAFGGHSRDAGRPSEDASPMTPVRPPSQDEPVFPPQPQTPTRPVDPKPEVDADQLADSILDKLANDPRFKGPKGDPGEPGPAGPPGMDGMDAVHDAEFWAQVDSRIDAKLAGIPQHPNPGNQQPNVHYTVVGQSTASYWTRIEEKVRFANDKYHKVLLAPPPANYTGPLPVVVRYTNGVPEYIARGQHETESVLTLLGLGRVP
jgi:hypothetical protein